MTYRFGIFEFDSESGELRRNGRAVPIERQPALALARLLESAGEVVSRDQMKEAVWGNDTHVDFDRGLAYCLSQIRSALGDSGENPRFVQTLPRKGYRFLAPVGNIANPPPTPRARYLWPAAAVVVVLAAVVGWASWRTADRTVIGVSIFDNETGNAEYDRLVMGLTDLVVTRLSEIAPERLAVIGNAAALRQPRNIRNLKAVATGVRADYVLLGQLQKSDTGLRFITHFIRLPGETHLKANRIPLPDGNVAGLESAVVAEFERAVGTYVLK